MTKRVISIMLCLIMLAAVFTGCGSAENSQTGATTAAGSAAATETQPEEELITVTFRELASGNAIDAFTAEEFESTPIGKYIKDKFKIRFEQLAASANDNMGDFVRDIASGQMADIVGWCATPGDQYYSVYTKAVNENQVAELGPVIDKVAPTLKKAIDPARLDLSPEMLTYPLGVDKGAYGLPRYYKLTPWVSGWGFHIRGDIPEQLGISLPHGWFTPDEFYDLLVKMKGAGIKDVNGNSAWPLGAIASWAESFTYAFDFGNWHSELVDGKVTGAFETDWPWQQVLYIRKLIKEKLLDPEIYTQNQQIALEKVKAGKYGITSFFVPNDLTGWDVYDAFASPGKPEWAYRMLGRMKNHRGDEFVTNNKGIQAIYVLLVNKNAPVERLMKVFEWALSDEGMRICYFGPDEQGYAVKADNGYKWNDSIYAQIKSGEFQKTSEYKAMSFMKTFTMAFGEDSPETNRMNGGSIMINMNEPSMTVKNEEREKQAALMFGNQIKMFDKYTFKWVGSSFTGYDKLEPVMSTYKDVLKRCYLAKTDEEAKKILENYVKSLMDNGYKEYLSFIQAEYDKEPDKFVDYVSPDMQ